MFGPLTQQQSAKHDSEVKINFSPIMACLAVTCHRKLMLNAPRVTRVN